MAEPTAVERRQNEELEEGKKKAKTAWDLLQTLAPSIKAVIPRHLTSERMAMIAFTAMKKSPRLLECTRDSIVGSIMTAAMLGLEPSGPLGHGALIPYWNSRAKTFECQFQPMYQGLLDLARRSGFIQDVQLRPVYQGDTYSYRFGLDPEITHIPMDGPEADDPDRIVTHVYCVIRLMGGGVQWDQMSWAQGIAHGLRYSPSSEGRKFKPGSVWADNPLPMIEKTVLKKVLKLCPKSPELAAALQQDDGAEMGRKMSVTKVGEGVYDVDFGEDPEGRETKQREQGSIGVADLKEGKETNRGHGNEDLDKVGKEKKAKEAKESKETKETKTTPVETATASAETKSAPVETSTVKHETVAAAEQPSEAASGSKESGDDTDGELLMTEQQFAQLERERTERGIDVNAWIKWSKARFNVRMLKDLKRKHYAVALEWTVNGGKL